MSCEEPVVPVYRCFLSGGPTEYRLTIPCRVGLLGGCLAGLPLALMAAGYVASAHAAVGLAISAAAISPLLAELVAHWAGRSPGAMAGTLALAGWAALSCWLAPAEIGAATASIVAILIYGLGQAPRRNPTGCRRPAAVAFYLAVGLAVVFGGPALVAPAAIVCLAALLGSEDSRGVRFFVSPLGLGLLMVAIAASTGTAGANPFFLSGQRSGPPALLAPGAEVACLMLGAALAWFSVRNGHAASPLGRLLVGWLIGPSLLAGTGLISTALAVAISLPAWAAMAGPALVDLHRRLRQRRFALRPSSVATVSCRRGQQRP